MIFFQIKLKAFYEALLLHYIFVVVLIGYGSVALANMDIKQFKVNDIQQLTTDFGKTNFSVDDVKNLFRNKCVEVAGNDIGDKAYGEIELEITSLGECINNIVNYTTIQIEIDEASPRGELDVVFNKYCSKRPKAIECVESFNKKLEPCLDDEERASKDVLMRIIRSLLNFICHKGGDQIALFIAEKGPECLETKKYQIQQCINNTFSNYIPKEENFKRIPKLVLNENQCQEIFNLETCIVRHLENCDEITPANIVESMFRFVKNETICRNSVRTSPAQQLSTNGSISTSSAKIFSLPIVFLLVLRKQF